MVPTPVHLSRWRAFGPSGRSPPWLQALRDSSGAYALRDSRTKKVLYVGTSRGHLKKTILRHVQQWTRNKSFWTLVWDSSRNGDPGQTYNRERTECAVMVTAPGLAGDAERVLIGRLKPRDNQNFTTADDETPF